MRSFLVRGLLAGLIAGVVTFGVTYVVGEPPLNAAIAWEQAVHLQTDSHVQTDGHTHGSAAPAEIETDVVPRGLQSTLGLLTGTVVAGITLGGLLGVLSAVALGRLGRLGARASTLTVTAVGFVALTVLPTLAYPPNPPGIGAGDSIGIRTTLYFLMIAVSVVAAVAAVLAGRALAPRWGSWYASLAAAAGYLVVTLVAVALLPTADAVPADFPADVLYEFRRASFVTQLTLWTVLGLALADLVHRLVMPSPVRVPAVRGAP